VSRVTGPASRRQGDAGHVRDLPRMEVSSAIRVMAAPISAMSMFNFNSPRAARSLAAAATSSSHTTPQQCQQRSVVALRDAVRVAGANECHEPGHTQAHPTLRNSR
jgi:hypothetical protein